MVTLLLVLGCDRHHPVPEVPPDLERPDPETPSRGGQVFYADSIGALPGCVACHDAVVPDTRVGPSLRGIARRATEAYVRESILAPGAFVVPGYADLMPHGYGDALSDEDLDALVDFLTWDHG